MRYDIYMSLGAKELKEAVVVQDLIQSLTVTFAYKIWLTKATSFNKIKPADSGLCPSLSVSSKTRHNVHETGSVSVLG